MLTTPEQLLDPELMRTCDKECEELLRALFQIGRSRELVQPVFVPVSDGQILCSTVPDHVARREHCRVTIFRSIAEISKAVEDHVTGRLGLKGDTAVECYEKFMCHYFEKARSQHLIALCEKFDIDFRNLLDQVIRHKKREMQARWPGRGRPSKAGRVTGTDELAQGLNELLSKKPWKGKKTQLSEEIQIDLKTLNKILAGEPVTSRIQDRVREATQRLRDTEASSLITKNRITPSAP